jgi:hypothetical protein
MKLALNLVFLMGKQPLIPNVEIKRNIPARNETLVMQLTAAPFYQYGSFRILCASK